jgi:hypothetical protein
VKRLGLLKIYNLKQYKDISTIKYIMNTRSGKRWNINELLSLQREYELLEWSVQQIAEKHERTVEAILFKLEAEGFITSWNEARGFDSQLYQSTWTTTVNECQCDENTIVNDDVVSETDKLTERVWNLETSLSEIGSLVKQMFDGMVAKKTSSKKSQLRKH